MNIIHASGGLANQMMQYIFLRHLEMNSNTSFTIDNLYLLSLENPGHNGFELGKVFTNIKLKCVTDYLMQDAIDQIIKTKIELKEKVSIPELLNENGILIENIFYENLGTITAFENKYNKNKTFKGNHIKIGEQGKPLHQIPIKTTGGYYVGIWYNFNYFQTVKNEMLFELQFPIITDRKNFEYLTQIKQTFSVGVHVRRGDFIDLGWGKSSQQYTPAVNLMREQINKNGKKPTFFIISDDIQWCKENVKDMGFTVSDDIVFIEGNTGNGMNYIDMQFLANCKFLIRNPMSTFSTVASWLNQNLIGQIEI